MLKTQSTTVKVHFVMPTPRSIIPAPPVVCDAYRRPPHPMLLSGYEFAGRPLRVERTKGRGGPGPSERGAGSYGGRHSEHRIFVEPIPKGGSWQDLKDFARAGGFSKCRELVSACCDFATDTLCWYIDDVLFADVQGDVGTLEFGNGDDVDRAVQGKFPESVLGVHRGSSRSEFHAWCSSK